MSFGIFQFRRGTAASATTANITLLAGELGIESDTHQFKIGDGVTAWNSLAYGGIQGTTGTRGSLIYTAAGAPTTVAGQLNGDLYLNITTSDLYQLVSGTWTLESNIKGGTGGVGTRGSLIYSGVGAPGTISGQLNNDLYINTTTEDVYQLVSGTWTVQTNIKGATGSTGSPASLGAVGGTSNANAGTIAGSVLSLAPASSAFPGVESAVDFVRARTSFDTYADFGIVCDLVSAFEVTSTGTQQVVAASAGVVTIPNAGATSPFAATDVGKRITISGAGASGAVYVGTISGFNSSTSVNVTPNASTTVTASTTVAVAVQWGTDNTTANAALVSAVNALNYPLAHIVINRQSGASGSWGLPVPMVFNKTVWIQGQGGGHTADTGDYTKIGGSRIAWWGTTSDGGTNFGAVITISPTGVQAIKRPQLSGCWIDCRNGDQNQALYGLKFASAHGALLDDGFFVMDAMGAGLWCDIASSPTEAADTTRFRFGALCFRNLDDSSQFPPTTTPTTTSTALTLTASGQTLTLASVTGFAAAGGYAWSQTTQGRPFLIKYAAVSGSTITGCVVSAEDVVHQPTTYANAFVVPATPSKGSAMKLSGGTAHNTSVGSIADVQMSYGTTFGPAAIDCGNSDTICFQQITGNGGSNVTEANGNRQRRPGIRFAGSTVSATLASRNIVIRDIDPGGSPGGPQGGISVMGVLNTGALMLAPSGPHYVELQQMGNGAPVPTVESGAILTWTGNGMFTPGPLPVAKPLAAVNLTAAVANVVGGTLVAVPPQAWQLGTHLKFRVPHHKTAVGTSIQATIRQSATGVAGSGTAISTVTWNSSALADDGDLEADLVITALGSGTTGAALGLFRLKHAFAATGLGTGAVTAGTITATSGTTGWQQMRGVAAGFDTTLPAQGPCFVWLEINPVTAATVLTIEPEVEAWCVKAANP